MFRPDNTSVVEKDSPILGEVLKYLQENPHWTVILESHKSSTDGSSRADLEITDKRARTVASWLEAHGIAAARLQPKALGRSKPITEKDTPQEIQRNERIELVKSTI